MTYASYVGRTDTRADTVGPDMLHRMAATLGVPVPDQVPPGWHWTLFQDWVPPDSLGPDGHPRRGGFLPPVHDLPRRMWAGGEVALLAPLHPGGAGRRAPPASPPHPPPPWRPHRRWRSCPIRCCCSATPP